MDSSSSGKKAGSLISPNKSRNKYDCIFIQNESCM